MYWLLSFNLPTQILLTYELKSNCASFIGQLLIILPQNQVFDSNSQYRTNDNNYFTAKKREKARHISLSTKAIAICAIKNADYYCQNINLGNKLLLIELDQSIVYAYQEVRI